jgi:hypothetical protein
MTGRDLPSLPPGAADAANAFLDGFRLAATDALPALLLNRLGPFEVVTPADVLSVVYAGSLAAASSLIKAVVAHSLDEIGPGAMEVYGLWLGTTCSGVAGGRIPVILLNETEAFAFAGSDAPDVETLIEALAVFPEGATVVLCERPWPWACDNDPGVPLWTGGGIVASNADGRPIVSAIIYRKHEGGGWMPSVTPWVKWEVWSGTNAEETLEVVSGVAARVAASAVAMAATLGTTEAAPPRMSRAEARRAERRARRPASAVSVRRLIGKVSVRRQVHTESGRRVAPHWRRGHWRRVWVGSVTDPERHQEPRFVPPVLVNEDLVVGGLRPVVYRSRRKG